MDTKLYKNFCFTYIFTLYKTADQDEKSTFFQNEGVYDLTKNISKANIIPRILSFSTGNQN